MLDFIARALIEAVLDLVVTYLRERIYQCARRKPYGFS